MKIFSCFLLFLLFITAQKTFAGPESASASAAQELGRQLIYSQITSQKKTFGEWMTKEIETYNLTKEARKSYEGLSEDDGFLKFLENRGIDKNQLTSSIAKHLALDYMGSSTNFRPAIVAWLNLISKFDATWESSYPLYLKVEAERPNDILPKAVILMRTVRTVEDAEKWFALFKDAYASALNSKERVLCLILLPIHAFSASTISGSDGHLLQLSDWLDDLEKKETGSRLPAIVEINFIKFLVAFARKDLVSAARLARGSRARAFEPILLILTGKIDEAGMAIDRLKMDATLTEQEKGLVTAAASILGKDERLIRDSEQKP